MRNAEMLASFNPGLSVATAAAEMMAGIGMRNAEMLASFNPGLSAVTAAAQLPDTMVQKKDDEEIKSIVKKDINKTDEK
jgi:hypothetical protein